MRFLTFSLLIVNICITPTLMAQTWYKIGAIPVNKPFDLTIQGNAIHTALGVGSNMVKKYTLEGVYIEDSHTGYVGAISTEANGNFYAETIISIQDVAHSNEWMYRVINDSNSGSIFAENLIDGSVYAYHLLDEGQEVAINPVNGDVAVADFSAQEIVIFNDTLAVIGVITNAGAVYGVVFDDEGNLHVSSSSPGDKVTHYIFQSSGIYNFVGVDDFGGTLGRPVSLAYVDGLLFIADELANEVVIASQTALPLEVGSLTVRKEGNYHLLQLVTLSEVNAERFEVERALDDGFFETIGEVFVNGRPSTYPFRSTPRYGMNYYRLKMIDLDGSYEYSKTIALTHGEEETSMVYPNPSIGRVTISHPARIYDGFGRLVDKTAHNNQSIELKNSGFYTVRFNSGQTQRLIITK